MLTWYAIGLVPRRWLFVRIVPAFRDAVLRHSLDHHDAQGEVGCHRGLIVMERLALVGSVFRSEILCLVILKAVKLILGNLSCFLSWVADRVLVAEVDVLEAGFNSSHLSKAK